MRWILALALLAGAAHAQDEEEEGCGETEIIVDGGGDGDISITVDPFADDTGERFESNRPPAVRVGTWPPPELGPAARRTLERLIAARDLARDDKGHRYRLADFYVKHKWYPHAEGEFLAAAHLDKESIRPWEGLIRSEPPRWLLWRRAFPASASGRTGRGV